MPSVKYQYRPQPQDIINLEALASTACVLSASTPTNTAQLQTRDYNANVTTDALANYTVGSEGALLNDLQAAVIATIAADVIVYLFISNDGGTTKRLRATATIKTQTISASVGAVPAKFYDASGNLFASIDDPARLAPGTKLYIGVASATQVIVTGEGTEYKRLPG